MNMKNKILTSTTVFLFSTLSLADSIAIHGMTCEGCEKQIRKVVCMDKEMSTWFNTCDAKVIDSKKEIGQINYTLKKNITLDESKMKKISAAVEDTGRSIIKTEIKK
jgi:hypothetical protein